MTNTESNLFIFIHIPKTSGRYMKKIIIENNKFDKKINFHSVQNPSPMWIPSSDHISIKELKKLINEDYLNYIKFFTIVRNPYNRLYSLWHFLKYGDTEKDNIPLSTGSFYLPEDFKKFIEYYCEGDYDCHYIFQSQLFFIKGEELSNIKILKYEDRNLINQFLNESKIEIKPNNVKQKNYMDFYTEEMKEMVYNKLKEEFTTFNYSK
jgi:hypothetical protein